MLSRVEWNKNLETGIAAIDQQHRRIVAYINEMVEMRERNTDHKDMGLLLDALVEYTYSHFSFEEALMEETGYDLQEVHMRTHQAFRAKINEYHSAFHQGEDVFERVGELLINWLIHHIMHDDQSYVVPIQQKLGKLDKQEFDTWIEHTRKVCFEDRVIH